MTRLILAMPQQDVEIDVSVSDDLRKMSERFLGEAILLSRSVPPGFKVSFQLETNPSPTVQVTVNATDVEKAAVLHRLRPFVLMNEALYVPSYLNAFKRENRSEAAVRSAAIMRDMFLVRVMPFVIQTHLGTVQLEELWQAYVNAYEYHRDDAKREDLEKNFAGMSGMVEFLFWSGVSTKLKAVIQMSGFAAMLAGQKDQFTVSLRDPEN